MLVRALAAPYNNFSSKALLLKAGLGDKGGRLVATGFDILQAIHTPSGAANLSSLSPQKAWLLQRILQRLAQTCASAGQRKATRHQDKISSL